MYLDYERNVYFQNYVSKTFATILVGINVWTGVILALTSFLVTYFLMRGRSRPEGSNKPNRFGKWAGRLHTQPSGVWKIAPALTSISPSPPSTEQTRVTSTAPASATSEASVKADSDTKKD